MLVGDWIDELVEGKAVLRGCLLQSDIFLTGDVASNVIFNASIHTDKG